MKNLALSTIVLLSGLPCYADSAKISMAVLNESGEITSALCENTTDCILSQEEFSIRAKISSTGSYIFISGNADIVFQNGRSWTQIVSSSDTVYVEIFNVAREGYIDGSLNDWSYIFGLYRTSE